MKQNKITMIIIIAGGITAVVAAAATIGIDLPKFAMQRHVTESAAKTDLRINILAGAVKSAQELSLENAIAAEELRAGNLEIQAGQLKAAGVDSRAVENQVKRLRKSVARRERELNKLRN